MKGNLTDNELSMVSELIATCTGLYFPGEKWNILSRNLVAAAMDFGYSDMKVFTQWLLAASLTREQIEILASHLTISETYFWREPQVFTALTDYILPELIKSKKKKEGNIRLWSAGCSTGEEAYSLAIVLHKAIAKTNDLNISVLATDINEKALLKARRGIYNPWSFRNSPSWLKSSYFNYNKERKYEIIPEIKDMVTFTSFNLTHRDFLSSVCNGHKMDIIFCRNVLMYFTKEWADRVSQNLYNSLSEKGWLVVSACELSSNLFLRFKPVNFPGAILYYKGDNGSSAFNIQSFDSDSKISINSFTQSTTDIKAVDHINIIDPECTVLDGKVNNIMNTTEGNKEVLHDEVENRPGLKSDEIILNENKQSIRLLADQGHLEEALMLCNKTLVSYKLIPGLYLLRASILQELNKNNDAIKSLKQAIYIDPENIMGHFTLGNLFIRQGNIKDANRHFSNALTLLSVCSNDAIPAGSEGLSVEYIREIIISNIQTQKAI